MKKYLLGITAILLAVGFSSFTASHNQRGSKNKRVSDPYYWYHVDALETQTDGSTVNSGGKVEKSEMLTESCDDSGSPICLVGFPDIEPSGTSISGLGSDQILRETDSK